MANGVGVIKCFMSHEKVKDHLLTFKLALATYYYGSFSSLPLPPPSPPDTSSMSALQYICNEFGFSSRNTQEDFSSQSRLLRRRDREKKIPGGGSVFPKD